MATILHTTPSLGTDASWIKARVDTWKEMRETRQRFRATLRELSVLSDREMADLGIHRSQVRSIAWEAANKAS